MICNMIFPMLGFKSRQPELGKLFLIRIWGHSLSYELNNFVDLLF